MLTLFVLVFWSSFFTTQFSQSHQFLILPLFMIPLSSLFSFLASLPILKNFLVSLTIFPFSGSIILPLTKGWEGNLWWFVMELRVLKGICWCLSEKKPSGWKTGRCSCSMFEVFSITLKDRDTISNQWSSMIFVCQALWYLFVKLYDIYLALKWVCILIKFPRCQIHWIGGNSIKRSKDYQFHWLDAIEDDILHRKYNIYCHF